MDTWRNWDLMSDTRQEQYPWTPIKIQDLVKRIRKPVTVEANRMYREIGIYSHGKGIFHKEERTGDSLGNKSVFWIEPDCFVVNIVFAWEQAIAKTTFSEEGMIASHRFPMYKPIKGKLDLDYLVYFFNTPRGKYLLGLASPGGAGRNKTLGQAAFLDLSIPIPSFSEQRRIAEILGEWDKAITLTERLIEAKQRRKKALMQQLLTGKVRFGEFSGEWEVKKLGGLSEKVGSGITPRGGSKAYLQEGVPLIRSQNVLSGNLSLETVVYISEEQHERMKNTQLRPRDVLLNITGASIGRSCVVPDDFIEGNVNQHVCIIRLKETLSPFYLSAILNSYMGQKLIWAFQAGGNREGLNFSQIRAFKIPLPSLDEQRRIAAVLQACDEEIEMLGQKLSALKGQKKGLMQQLLTGKVRPSRFSKP
ncbi:restriction endonuclease subunit S [Chloroflexota bacterium]